MLRYNESYRLLHSGLHADFTIQCGERKWRVHKIVMERCAYYKTLLDPTRNWKMGGTFCTLLETSEPPRCLLK